ncbi:hypothetical protein LTR64_001907 [Lithohypha guttulata]|uniref:uncharacterized protein n=1 Tax=Lithohypha guttulata TaxID=1690604 RepID=UPI002DDF0113|nr:hypothetical protein LTR51_007766 [Lithohypha guttulata]
MVTKHALQASNVPSDSANTTAIRSFDMAGKVGTQRPGGRRLRRRHKNLSIEVVPGRITDKFAIRGSLCVSPRATMQSPQAGVTSPTQNSSGRQHRMQPPLRPSPRSLREARLKKLLKSMAESELGSDTNVLRDHHCMPLLRGHYEGGSRGAAERPRPVGHGAPSGDSDPNSPAQQLNHPDQEPRATEPNVHFRLANLGAERIADFAHQGYVVDIVPPVAVQNLPLTPSTRQVVDTFLCHGRNGTIAGYGPYRRSCAPPTANTWGQWAYVSRLAISDIGRDGRRRTLAHTTDEIHAKENEKWHVALVPLNSRQAIQLRGLLENKI